MQRKLDSYFSPKPQAKSTNNNNITSSTQPRQQANAIQNQFSPVRSQQQPQAASALSPQQLAEQIERNRQAALERLNKSKLARSPAQSAPTPPPNRVGTTTPQNPAAGDASNLRKRGRPLTAVMDALASNGSNNEPKFTGNSNPANSSTSYNSRFTPSSNNVSYGSNAASPCQLPTKKFRFTGQNSDTENIPERNQTMPTFSSPQKPQHPIAQPQQPQQQQQQRQETANSKLARFAYVAPVETNSVGNGNIIMEEPAAVRANNTNIRTPIPRTSIDDNDNSKQHAITKPRAVVDDDDEGESTIFAKKPKSTGSTTKGGPRGRGAKEEVRYPFLQDVMDANKRRPDHPEYDPRTLYISPNDLGKLTGFERQYWEIKKNHFDVVLFFKKGKFYELYENDADIGHREFDLKLTDRVNMKMVGVPEASFDIWAAKFIAAGYDIGRVEQMETMSDANKRKESNRKNASVKDSICQRELRQVVTCGTVVDEFLIGGSSARYLLALKEDTANNCFGICYVDAAAAEFTLGYIEDDPQLTQLGTLLHQVAPKEVLYEKGGISQNTLKLLKKNTHMPPKLRALAAPKDFLDRDAALQLIEGKGYFIDKNGIENYPKELLKYQDNGTVMSALGTCLKYLQMLMIDEDTVSLRHFREYDPTNDSRSLILDGQTLLNLEILQNNHDGTTSGTLIELLDHTVTPFGKRLFKQWVCHPLRSIAAIEDRLNAIEDLARLSQSGKVDFKELRDVMKKIPDLERLITRIHSLARVEKEVAMYDDSNKRKIKMFVDVIRGFKRCLEVIVIMEPFLSSCSSTILREIMTKGGGFPDIDSTLKFFEDSFNFDEALQTGLIIPNDGVYKQYDEISQHLKELEKQMDNELQRCRKEIFKSNSVNFKDISKEKYLIEVPVADVKRAGKSIPADFIRVSETKTQVRFRTPTIAELLPELTDAIERREQVCQGILKVLCEQFDEYFQMWTNAISCIAKLDCLMSLWTTSYSQHMNMVRPRLVAPSAETTPFIDFKTMVHPCILPSLATEFIPNDVHLGGNKNPSVALLTGPNMGGKSTLLRSTCITVILAQLGCFVPCESCTLTPVDRIFTRIGASDRIMSGESTFMVELEETSTILNCATRDSLVILDELGRGTSTFDGYSIAHAVLDYLASTIRCRTLFSTHYFMLTEAFEKNPLVGLYHMDCLVEPNKREVQFLYKFVPGVCPKSYGLNVAVMAGISEEIVARAEVIAEDFEITVKQNRRNNSGTSHGKNEATGDDKASNNDYQLFAALASLLESTDKLTLQDVQDLQNQIAAMQ